ncbi:MAG: hypothetical protein KJO23_08125 [Bacteroidia bacterium]|nr:hypothetical protein [Bacteroidia bacterium]NNM23493.1 hypothetical protein [Flavobacteriaceae bacterium]
MFIKTNIQERLIEVRNRRLSGSHILTEVHQVLRKNELERAGIKTRLSNSGDHTNASLKLELLNGEAIFHLNDIRKMCVDYRLRFLDSSYFKGEIPEEAISKIRRIEKEHDTSLTKMKIMAPAKLLKLENADDPLLFASLGNDYFYLIHKWGNDLHPFRKLLMWPYKNFENLVFTIFMLSVLLTALTPMQAFTKGAVSNQEYLLMFLFMFKAVGGIVLFYGFAKGKNFNSAIWNSKYYNG